eukprot:gene27276-biopygen7989
MERRSSFVYSSSDGGRRAGGEQIWVVKPPKLAHHQPGAITSDPSFNTNKCYRLLGSDVRLTFISSKSISLKTTQSWEFNPVQI